jgi:hypothetical protein
LNDYDRAEYEAEMAMGREDARRSAFIGAFDLDTTPGRTGEHVDGVFHRQYGPVKAPWCEGCCKVLSRDEPEGIYDEEWGLFYCSSKCHEEHGMHNSGYVDDREDFRADWDPYYQEEPEWDDYTGERIY